jgi:two-component system, NtrC family, response regulator AtoC
MGVDLQSVIIDVKGSAASRLQERLKEAGIQTISLAEPQISIRELEDLSCDLYVIGPAIVPDARLMLITDIRITHPHTPVLALTDAPGRERGETFDYPFEGIHQVKADFNRQELVDVVEQATKQREESESLPPYSVMVGQSEGIRRIRAQVRRISGKDITVLITGESGTGKELIARAIHYHSPRRHGPLVKINCAALPDELLESEIFGFQKGAFTGAHKTKPGRIELAEGGTLFIDEIGDVSLNLQVKFLQVLEDKAFARLGGTEDRSVDARVVVATNAHLHKKVMDGTFRKDLYYRLNIVNIQAQPLRERKEDMSVLAHYFMNKYCHEFRKEPLEIQDKVIKLFQAYHWPGNVRELENVVRRALVLRNWDAVIKELQLGDGIDNSVEGALFRESGLGRSWSDNKVKKFFRESDFSLKKISRVYVSEIEKEAIVMALKETRWNRRKAAELLQVSYKTILNRMEELDIRP